MNCLRALEFLLFFFFHRACSEEAEPTFRTAGHSFEMGYCFGVDYIVVYRSHPEGEQLLGNSSDDRPAVTPPADLQGRVYVSQRNHLLGLQIRQLRQGDSGIYRRECWKNQTRVKQHTHRLFVCDHEAEAREFGQDPLEEGGWVELRCNATSTTLQGASVRWYIELPPLYRYQLVLDSGVSLDLLVDELRGAVEVGSGGTSLSVDFSVLKDHQEVYCLVMREKKCLLYQNMYRPVHTESKDVFALLGERVVLGCPFEDNTQQWETPVGGLNSSNVRNRQMHISEGTPKTFSLVIPVVTDELIGEYTCITPSLELQFSLSVCPPKPITENTISEDGSVLLECDVGQEEYQELRWYRQDTSGEHKLIHDSNDPTVPVPDDLWLRMTLLRNGSSLRLSSAKTEAGLTYSCVVLGTAEIALGVDGDYTDDYDEEETQDDKEYDDSTDSTMFLEAHKCIFKQRNTVVLMQTTSTEDNSRTIVTSKPKSNFETTSTPEPGSSIVIPALAIGMVVLVLAGVIIAIVVTRRRAAANQADAAHEMHDTECTRSLNSPDGNGF